MTSTLRIRRPDLIVDNPWRLILRFVTEDRSSMGVNSYDSYIAGGTSPLNRVVLEDVVAINTTMGARSPHTDWTAVIARGALPELKAIDVMWDVFSTSDKTWAKQPIGEQVAILLDSVMSKGIGLARATKVLHIKRPRLIPVCDSYVLRLMGIPGDDGASAAALIEHLRNLRGDLRPTLVELRKKLLERGYDRTLLRITDALIWSSYPDTSGKRRLAGQTSRRR
jgi:hypothetical protein